jgi:hypothetical protein
VCAAAPPVVLLGSHVRTKKIGKSGSRGWTNLFFAVFEKFLQPIHAPWVYGAYLGSARIWLLMHVNNSDFLQIILLNPNFLLAHRNRYLEVMDDGQITPHGYANFYSYVKNLRVLVFMTDRQRH